MQIFIIIKKELIVLCWSTVLAIHAPLGRSWLVPDTLLVPTSQGWGAEQERIRFSRMEKSGSGAN